MAGNSVVLKHSSQTPLCGERLVASFNAAGLPEQVFQYIHLQHHISQYVISHCPIQHIAFTGSVTGGIEVEEAAAGRFLSIGLELGGKDPAYIRADADVVTAAAAVIDGALFNSGQSCCGIERIYVHQDCYDDFITQVRSCLGDYRLGDPLDSQTSLGPMVNARAADRARAQVAEALALGAQLLPIIFSHPLDHAGSAYLTPQILVNVDHSMLLMREESFAPIVGIQKVSSDAQAVALMNDSEFGLTACIFSQDIAAATALGELVDTGTVFINRCDYLDPGLAWTGVKRSGKGCSLSKFGYDALTRPKSIHIKELER